LVKETQTETKIDSSALNETDAIVKAGAVTGL